MMNQEESMRNLRRLLDDMQQILNKKNESPHLHALEIDLLKQKTLNIYDTLIHLNPSNQSAEKPLQNTDKKQPPEPKPVPSAPLTSEVSTPKKKTESQTQNPTTPMARKQDSQTEPAREPLTEKTTLDLFSDTSTSTIGETIAKNDALGERLQTTPISDLREAIGINDKFVFINQLFKGDMERYNRILDELNGFSSLKGAQTYLTELAVEYQWNTEDPAYLKLADMIERKFS